MILFRVFYVVPGLCIGVKWIRPLSIDGFIQKRENVATKIQSKTDDRRRLEKTNAFARFAHAVVLFGTVGMDLMC